MRLFGINIFPWFWITNLVNALKEDKTGIMFEGVFLHTFS